MPQRLPEQLLSSKAPPPFIQASQLAVSIQTQTQTQNFLERTRSSNQFTKAIPFYF